MLATWRDGRVKQAVIARALRLRAETGELFTAGSYTPIKVEGERADHVVAFARVHEGRAALVAVTRLPLHLEGLAALPLPSSDGWDGTFLTIPRNFLTRRIVDVLASNVTAGAELAGRIPVSELFSSLPVALLEVR